MDPLADQLAQVQRRNPGARLETTADGSRVLVVPDIRLAPGWNDSSTTLRILIPVGFPHVKPDCFYTDPTLLLATGTEPASSNLQDIFGGRYRWFSWHISNWDPIRGSLDQYLRVCERRLKEAQ